MTPTMMELARYRCRLHAMERAVERGVPIDDLRRFEYVLERCRPAFEHPDRRRHLVIVLHRGVRIHAVWDSHLQCVVTVWRRERERL